MSVLSDWLEKFLAKGFTQEEATLAVAEIFGAGVASVGYRKSPAAERQSRYRERNKASQTVTPKSEEQASQTVTNHNESVTRNAASISSLPSTDLVTEKKEKKERGISKRNGPIPEGWLPPERSKLLAVELGLELAPIEARFRDYCASSGKKYADHDAAFCNFVRNTPNFSGNGTHGKSESLASVAKRQSESGIRFGPRPTGIRLGPSGDDVRLLSQAGRERP